MSETEVCLICNELPCGCRSKKTRRTSSSKPRSASPPPPEAKARKLVKRTIQRATSVEAQAKVTPPTAPPEIDEESIVKSDDEDFELIRAVRLLAHLIDPRDPNLAKLGDAILPSDRLPPEERIPDWKRRVGGS